MSDGLITTERRGHVLLMGIDRVKKRNAFTPQMYEGLGHAYGELDRDEELRCGVLYAHGDHFTGGLDLGKWTEIFRGDHFPVPDGGIDPLGSHGARLRKPVVCAVQGICLTIGIELLLATDVRVAASDARFGQIEVKRGIYPVGGATVRLPAQAGWANAMRWLLTGDTFDATEAHRIGMVQEVVEPGTQLDRALELAETIAAQAPLGVYATLASARLAHAAGEQAAMERLLPDLAPIMDSEDAAEGLASFLERREAKFEGR